MKKIFQIIVYFDGMCLWFFDSAEEAEIARQYTIKHKLVVPTDNVINFLPGGEILTSSFEFIDFYDRLILEASR